MSNLITSPFGRVISCFAKSTVTRAFWPFHDHHVFAPTELRRLEAFARSMNARTLLTTEKDSCNLEPDWYLSIRQTPLYWLKIATEIEDGDALVKLIVERAGL